MTKIWVELINKKIVIVINLKLIPKKIISSSIEIRQFNEFDNILKKYLLVFDT